MKLATLFLLSGFTCLSIAESYIELVPGFSRQKSTVMVRKIEKATMANLDFAAYDRNPVLNDPVAAKPKKKPSVGSISDFTFNNTISDVKSALSETPLTDSEKQSPLAWKPLLKKLWNVAKDDKLQSLSSKVASYKWADPQVFQSYQEITAAYVHTVPEGIELWVKIEFSPWVNFIKFVKDADGDGIKEVYGKLIVNEISADTLSKFVNWIQNDYCKTILTQEQMVDWITDLASYWYPTKNTDILDIGSTGQWPLETTNKKVVKELQGQTFSNILAVVEGKPISPEKPVYNVFIADAEKNTEKAVINDVVVSKSEGGRLPDTVKSNNFKKNEERFALEITENGSYDAWYLKNSAFLNGASKWLSAFPAEQMGLEGKDGWLFFRKSFEYMYGKDYSLQSREKNPIPNLADFKKYLADKNVNLLFVVVPNKEEVYYDKISSDIPAPSVKYVNPYSRKILSDIQSAGIEVIDLLPYLSEARKDDTTGKEYLYQLHDTHWTNRGLQIAAKLIADRIKEYSWYSTVEKSKFSIKDTTFERQGDIVERIPEQSRSKYQAVRLNAQQVYVSDSILYKGNNASAPIMLIGDSFTGVFESVDCKGAGVGAHIAAQSGIPVEIITSWGGGPLVRKKAMRTRESNLGTKRLVVYMMVARDLFNYAQNWEKFPE